jgi:hypothetical protein
MATQAENSGTDALDHDRQEILARHKDWWESNAGWDIPRMASCFPTGMNYLMFNTNGHPYFGLDEKIKLWRWYRGQLDMTMGDIFIMKLEIQGDMGWLACEGVWPARLITEAGTGSGIWQVTTEKEYDQVRLRATEIYRRDDGEGNPVWKMWHFHCSQLAPEDEPRPGFNDTSRERGLGWNPWGQPLRVVST